MHGTTIVKEKIDYFSHIVESVNNYKAYTNFPFLLCEASLVAQLLQQGLSLQHVKRQFLDSSPEIIPNIDILQIRSKASRQGTMRALEQLLTNIPPPYIQFLATGHSDLRRHTLLFLTLRTNRLLREVISEVLLERLKSLDRSLDRNTLAAFFDLKCEQENVMNRWSKSTYQKVCSNTILILVRSGLLIASQDKKTYEIQAMPVPIQLRKQLETDRLELYLKLMLN
jgi:Putative inner membrane protein (DUF1819)